MTAEVERTQVVVIGGGVIGCAILFELARRGVAGILLESAPDVCEGTSKANSAILHTGFDSKAGTVESAMLRRAATLWPERLEELSVPFLRTGALMIARSDDDAARLSSVMAPNAEALGVETHLLDRRAIHEVAPFLAEDVVAALSIPNESIVDPFWLTRAFAEAAIAGGAEVRLGNRVMSLEVDDGAVRIGLADGGVIEAEQAVDAAGIHADDVAALAGDRSFALTPRKGEFLISEETFGVDRIVLPIPGPMGKGMLVTPIVFGGLLLGPTAVDIDRKDDLSTDPGERASIVESCRSMVPAVADMVPIRQFTGIRHVSSTGEFILRPSVVGDRLYLAAGIRSTGISTSPAVAEAVVNDILARRGWRRRPARRLAPPPIEIPEEPGEVVCLCRSISRAEVLAACRHQPAPMTLDGVKRRGGATFGDCQGNLCALEVARLISSERAIPIEAVEKHDRGSWLWEAQPRGITSVAPPDRALGREVGASGPFDVAIIGYGMAGRAAAEAASRATSRVLVVERRADRLADGALPAPTVTLEATVVGLQSTMDGWVIQAQGRTASAELQAAAVIVASGAYVEPREHRPIAGPRPAGVMTADLAESILDANFCPGRQVALIGRGDRARRLARSLEVASASVTRLDAEPEALRGRLRLEAVRVDGEWLAADTLIFADRPLAQTFLLRGLGLVDGRPGIQAPVDTAGRLPLPGLWAAGCCVAPSIDHAGCANAGRQVGGAAGHAAVAARMGGGSSPPWTSWPGGRDADR